MAAITRRKRERYNAGSGRLTGEIDNGLGKDFIMFIWGGGEGSCGSRLIVGMRQRIRNEGARVRLWLGYLYIYF